MRLSLVLALLALAACDSQAPPRTNPFDPGAAGIRTVTAPADLALASSTPTSVTLSWTDRSSFETGVLVTQRLSGSTGPFDTLATLPADATTYTDTGLTGAEALEYRVTAFADGANDSAPSPPLNVRFPTRTLALGQINTVDFSISRDGEHLYLPVSGGVRVVSLRTGAEILRVSAPGTLLDVLADGRFVFRDSQGENSFRLAFYDGTTLQSEATLRSVQGGCRAFQSAGSSTVRVSADGRRAMAVCGFEVEVWDVSQPTPASRFSIDLSSVGNAGLSPDGRRVYLGATASQAVSAYDAATGALAWSVPSIDGNPLGLTRRRDPDGSVFAFVVDGRVLVVDAVTGAVRASAPVTNATIVATGPETVLISSFIIGAGATYRLLRRSDLSLVRTLAPLPLGAVRLTPGGLVTLGTADGQTVAVRIDLNAVWQVAP